MALEPGETCATCLEREERYIRVAEVPYELGFRATCGECKTTNKFLWLGFFECGKSDTLIEWLAWMIGRATNAESIPMAGWISYADAVATLRSVAIRDTIEFSPQYRLVFPNALPMKKKGWGESEWFIQRRDVSKKDPTLRASGINGSILSYRFPTAEVIDDPQDPREIRSQTYRDDTWNIWWGTIRSRASEDVTPIVVGANRWAEDDIPGRMMAIEKDWAILITPALDEEDQTVFGREQWRGVTIGKTTESLHKLRDEDSRRFNTSYMCQPPSEEGDLFQHFSYGDQPVPQQAVRCVQFWDTTTTQKTSSDFNSMTEAWKLTNGRTIFYKVSNFKAVPSETMRVMLEEYWRAEGDGLKPIIVIEDAQAGSFFVEMLKKNSGVRVKAHSMGGFGKGQGRRGPRDLYSRAAAIVQYFDGGIVYFPQKWNEWRDFCINQYKAYSGKQSAHDDMVASGVGAVEYLYPARRMGRPQSRKVGSLVTGFRH